MLPARSDLIRPFLLALLASTVVTLGAGAPARADYFYSYDLDTHPQGLPASDVPGRQLVSGELTFHSNRDGLAGSAAIELGGEPTESEDADLVLAVGERDPESQECVARWQRQISTFAPETSVPDPDDLATTASREATTVEVAWALTPEEYALTNGSCAFARVVDPDEGTTLDGLDGVFRGGVVGDPVYRAKIGDVTGRHVRPGRWSRLTVQVKSKSDVRGFALYGRGRGVSKVERYFERRVPNGSTTTVHLRVRLKAERPRELTLYLATTGSAFGPADVKRVQIVPKRRG